MAALSSAGVKRKVFENSENVGSSESDFDSDDSLRDKDYVESSDNSHSSEESEKSVSLKTMWLITF